MLRRRKEVISEVIKVTKNLDAFPKLEDDYQETSSTRGTSKDIYHFKYLINNFFSSNCCCPGSNIYTCHS